MAHEVYIYDHQINAKIMEMIIYVFTHLVLFSCMLAIAYVIGTIRTEPGDDLEQW